jgi:type II secretory pathway component GspD/PulD (secretin)
VDAGGHPAAHLLSPEEEAAVLSAIETGGIDQVTAPRITVYDRQTANCSVLNQVSYVQDFEVQRVGDGREVADPIVATVQDGVVVAMTPTLSAGEKEVLLALDLQISDLVRPMEEYRAALAGTQVAIQLPEVRIARLQRRVAIPVGRTYAVGGLPGNDSGRTLVALVRIAEVIDDETLEVELDIAPPPK